MTAKRFFILIDDEYEDILPCIRDRTFKIKDIYGHYKYDDLKEICNELNALSEENQIKLEIVDAFICGLEDEKGIVPEDREFQCKMNHTIKMLKELKKDMLNPSEFKRLKELWKNG